MNYLWHILILISLYSVLAGSLNLLVGYTGLLSLCHAAFYGIGAYVTALLMTRCDWPFLLALPTATVITGLLSLSVSIPALRLKGDFFVLATLGFQIITFSVLYNWTGLTGGPYGITSIPPPRLFGVEFGSVTLYCFLCILFAAICFLLLTKIAGSPFGRTLRAIREDEIATRALGKNVTFFKIMAFIIAAMFAAIAGGLFAGYMRFIDPTSFTMLESIFIISIVIIGGAGSPTGPILGAVFAIVLPEALRFLHFPDAISANLRQVMYGVLLMVLMRIRPQGIQGAYDFD